MENIILCGMMGCGKTTCANLLGGKLGRQVVDTDDLVVKKAGMSISELFAAQGETAMRDLETEVARELSRRSDLIIATGGGLPLREENRQLLRDTGIVVFLRAGSRRDLRHRRYVRPPSGAAGAGTLFFPGLPSGNPFIRNFHISSFTISPARRPPWRRS